MSDLRKRVFQTRDAVLRRIRGLPQPGRVAFGDLRRTEPISHEFGVDRGGSIDRYYIEGFLGQHALDVRGRVLEFGDNAYTTRFGGENVVRSDIWHVHDRNPRATIVGDLASPPSVPGNAFDCIICTQTLQYVSDPAAGVATLRHMLTPGGVLLATMPGISPVATRSEWGATWYWAFTAVGVERLLRTEFRGGTFSIATYGNVLAAIAFLHGLSPADLSADELNDTDPDYPVTIAARVCKPLEVQ